MLNDILKLNDAKKLNKAEQKSIQGGFGVVGQTAENICIQSGGTWQCVTGQGCGCLLGDGCSDANLHVNCADIKQ